MYLSAISRTLTRGCDRVTEAVCAAFVFTIYIRVSQNNVIIQSRLECPDCYVCKYLYTADLDRPNALVFQFGSRPDVPRLL